MDRAREFAERFDGDDPAVYRIVVEARHVLAYLSAKEEEEFIVWLPEAADPERSERAEQ